MGNGRARKPYCCMILLSIGAPTAQATHEGDGSRPQRCPSSRVGRTLAAKTSHRENPADSSLSRRHDRQLLDRDVVEHHRHVDVPSADVTVEVRLAGAAPVLDGAAGGKGSLAARSTILRLPLHSMRLGRRSLNFAHVPVVYAGHLSIVPGDRDCIPPCFGDNAAIGGIASPKNTGALLEVLGFRDGHCCSTGCLGRTHSTASGLSLSPF